MVWKIWWIFWNIAVWSQSRRFGKSQMWLWWALSAKGLDALFVTEFSSEASFIIAMVYWTTLSRFLLPFSAKEKEEPPLNSTVHQEFMIISWPSITTCFGHWHFVFTSDAYISFSKKDPMRSQHHAGQRRQITANNAASFVCIVS